MLEIDGSRGSHRRLAEAFRDGDAVAFARIYERYRDPLFAVCLRRLGSAAFAEDAVQETFISAFRNCGTLDPQKPIWPWLLTIAQRRCIDLCRRQAGLSVVEDIETSHRSAKAWRHPEFDTTLSAVIGAEDRARVGRALKRLPARQRRVLTLHALEGWSMADIAFAERISVSSIKSLIFRARCTLRKSYESGVLGTLLVPVHWTRRRTRRVLDRIAGGVDVALATIAGTANAVEAGFMAIVLAMATGGAALPTIPAAAAAQPVPFSYGVDAVRSGFSGPRAAGLGGRDSVAGFRVHDRAGEIATQLTDPTGGAAPDSTQIVSLTASPRFASDHTIFAVGNVGCLKSPCLVLFVSRDAGRTWSKPRASGFSGRYVLLPPAFPSDPRIFAMSHLGLQRSVDGGDSFDMVSPIPGEAAISPAFNASHGTNGDGVILIATAPTLMEYTATDDTTKPLLQASIPRDYSSVAFVPGAPEMTILAGTSQVTTSGLYGSVVERCRSRTCASLSLDASGSPRFVVAAPDMIFAFTGGDLFRSRDGGFSFDKLRPPFAEPTKLSSIAAWPINSARMVIFAALSTKGSANLYRSYDAGETWEPSTIGLPGFELGVRAVTTTPTGRVFASGLNRGIACSTDGGATWTPRCR